jgi:hypothetical protein
VGGNRAQIQEGQLLSPEVELSQDFGLNLTYMICGITLYDIGLEEPSFNE